MTKDEMPSFVDLMQPTLTALHRLGGIAGTFMIEEEVIEDLKLPKEAVERTRPAPDDPRREISYRLAWVRTYLRKYGLIENVEHGLWQLTPQGERVETVDPRAVMKHIQRQRSRAQTAGEA